MKAVLYKGKNAIELTEVPDPEIQSPTDAIVEIEMCSVSGLDIHALHGTLGEMVYGTILGHEGIGRVHKRGADVRDFKNGDRVVICSTVACGYCPSCKSGNYSMCDTVQKNLHSEGCTFFGSPKSYGSLNGLQAQKACIPFANISLVKLPDTITDDQALYLSDLFPTGYFAAENASVQPNSTVAVFGCGPVGQFAIASAKLMGAARIIAVDSQIHNLDMAKAQGAEVIDFEAEDPVTTIKKLTGGVGTDCVIDAVGVDVRHWHAMLSETAVENDDMFNEAGFRTSSWAVHAVSKGGTISMVGIYPKDVKIFPIGEARQKNITIRIGQCNHRKYIPHLIELIENGTVDPLEIYTRISPFSGVYNAYSAIEEKRADWIKMERFLLFSKPI